jgi:hypothetical protein
MTLHDSIKQELMQGSMHFEFYYTHYDAIWKIINLAQCNREFFGATIGDDALNSVASKLEQLIKEHNDKENKKAIRKV